jgi:hypothetical protein
MLAHARTRIAPLAGTAQLEVADAHTLSFPGRPPMVMSTASIGPVGGVTLRACDTSK